MSPLLRGIRSSISAASSSARKPERAWKRLAGLDRDQLPEPLVRAVELALAVAGPGLPTYS